MENIEKGGIIIHQFSNLNGFGKLKHFITGRKGGYSKGTFAGMNTGFHVGDSDWHVLQNRKKLAAILGVDLQRFTFASQTHSSNIAIVDACKKGKGSTDCESALANTDALICNTPGIFICIQVADCVPILLFDTKNHVIAAIHAGWRGTLRKITEATVRMMMHTFESHPADIQVGIGPANGPCCYEVGEDVKAETLKSLGTLQGILKPSAMPGKYIFDQWNANYLQLLNCGIPHENIELSGLCTQCNADSFFSSRKDNGITGRTAAGIMLNP